MRIKVSHPIIFTSILALAMLVPVIGILLMLDCERDIKSPSQAVDFGPFIALEWPSDITQITDAMDLSVLESPEVSADGRIVEGVLSYNENMKSASRGVRISAWIESFSSAESAKEAFASDYRLKEYFQDSSGFTYGENGDMEYCISYVRAMRSGPGGLCLPMGTYESLVGIRKRNVVILIRESTGNKSETRKNEAIKQLAEAFASQKSDKEGE